MGCAAEDGDAIERVMVVAWVVKSVVDGECRAVAGFFYDALYLVVICAARIGDGCDTFLEVFFDCSF